MVSKEERRKQGRKVFDEPILGALYKTVKHVPDAEPVTPLFIDILDLSATGAMLDSSRETAPGSVLNLLFKKPAGDEWRSFRVALVWTAPAPGSHHRMGVRFLQRLLDHSPRDLQRVRASLESIEFLAGIPLLEYMPRGTVCDLFNCLQPETFAAGERLIRQGDTGDCMYIIEKGTCAVKVEAHGQVQQIDRLTPGEVAGEMALITGEPRSAHVDAETDVTAWRLSKDDFESISDKYPDVRAFLTELVVRRLDSSPVMAVRSVGKYLIKRKLGRGGWSIVYEGQHGILNFPVAIKMMRHDMALNPDFLDFFKKEAMLIAGMNHGNIVHVYDIEELYRTVFIIMEYLDGYSLEDLLKQVGRLPVPRVVNFLVQACAALSYAHKQGIVHQDIKPANIFVLQNDQIKILDFGLACAAGSEVGSFLGTLHYTAPEQVAGGVIGPRVDLYALGITAYELLAGHRPYPEEDLDALVDMHLNVDIPDPLEAVPDMPEQLRQFIIKACRRDPEARYQSADEVLDDLVPLSRTLGCPDLCQGSEIRKMTTLLLSYTKDRELELKKALDRFSSDVQEMGVLIRSADFENI